MRTEITTRTRRLEKVQEERTAMANPVHAWRVPEMRPGLGLGGQASADNIGPSRTLKDFGFYPQENREALQRSDKIRLTFSK